MMRSVFRSRATDRPLPAEEFCSFFLPTFFSLYGHQIVTKIDGLRRIENFLLRNRSSSLAFPTPKLYPRFLGVLSLTVVPE